MTIYLLTRGMKTLILSEMTTSSQKYEFGLAKHLAEHAEVRILTTALGEGKQHFLDGVTLIGVRTANKKKKYIESDFYNYLAQKDAKNAAIVFWGYSLPMVKTARSLQKKLGFKCISFIYDSHKPALATSKGLKKLILNMRFEKGKRLSRFFDGYILFQEKAVDRLRISSKPYIISKPGVYGNSSILPNPKLPFTISYCGSLTELNGIHLLLEAMPILNDTGVRVLICGEGPLKKEVEQATKAYSSLEYRGLLNGIELFKLYEETHLLLNLRRLDDEAMDFAFPSKTFEYINTGLPMLTTRVLSDHEFCDNTFILDTFSADELAKMIQSVRANYDLALQKASKAKQYILSRYSFQASAEHIFLFLNSISNEKR